MSDPIDGCPRCTYGAIAAVPGTTVGTCADHYPERRGTHRFDPEHDEFLLVTSATGKVLGLGKIKHTSPGFHWVHVVTGDQATGRAMAAMGVPLEAARSPHAEDVTQCLDCEDPMWSWTCMDPEHPVCAPCLGRQYKRSTPA